MDSDQRENRTTTPTSLCESESAHDFMVRHLREQARYKREEARSFEMLADELENHGRFTREASGVLAQAIARLTK